MKAAPALQRLQQLYPRIMGDTVVPLKRGVYEELLATHSADFDPDALKEALRQHTRSTRYLQAMAAGLGRHDLSGQTIEPVSPEHRYQSMGELYRRRLSRPQARPGDRRSPEQMRDHFLGQWQRRVLEAFDASGMDRASYSAQMRGRDERANAVLDAAMADAATRAARDEALLRAFESTAQDEASFASDYGLPLAQAQASLQRARIARVPAPGVQAEPGQAAEDVPDALTTAEPVARQIRGAIIDLDGTMVDTLGDFVVALNAALQELSLPAIEAEQVRVRVGKGSENLIRSVLAHVGAPPETYEPALASYQRHYLQINGQHSEVYPEVVTGLRRLQGMGVRMACLTNKPTAFALPLLVAKGLDGYFEAVFGGDAFERRKPDPLPVQRTCEALGLSPAEVLMVGDSLNDSEAARAAGCPVALVRYGYNHGEVLTSDDADQLVDVLTDIRL